MFLHAGASAQMTAHDEDPAMENFHCQVKQISEFFSRINGETSNSDSLSRKMNLTSLFQKETYFENQDYAIDFIERTTPERKYIDYTDSTWHAVAECVVELTPKPGKEHPIILTMRVEKCEEEFQYKWVIAGASGDILALKPRKCNSGLKISPLDNEVNFMSLKHISDNEHPNIMNFASRSYTLDTTAVFYSMIHNNLLKIKYVSKLYYIFDDIAGYRLRVDYRSGNTRNAGWLISEISPNIEKLDHLHSKFLFK